MIIGYIYCFNDGSFQVLEMRIALNKYMKEFEMLQSKTEKVIARWVVKKKV